MVKIDEFRLAPNTQRTIDKRAEHASYNKDFIYEKYIGYLPPRNENELITKVELTIGIDFHTYDVMMFIYASSFMLVNNYTWEWANLWEDECARNGIASNDDLAGHLSDLGYDIDKVTILK